MYINVCPFKSLKRFDGLKYLHLYHIIILNLYAEQIGRESVWPIKYLIRLYSLKNPENIPLNNYI